MKFLLDENVEFTLATYLEELGHDVVTIVRDYPRALQDSEVLEIARAEGRILITNDHDFGELVIRRGLAHHGVILLRLEDESMAARRGRMNHVLSTYSSELRHFLIVTERGVRIRRRPGS